jgi:uracil-DNA glycosylase
LLNNLITEASRHTGVDIPRTANSLSGWASQGVLLINSVLTAREKEPGSHFDIGWQQFTDEVIKAALGKRPMICVLCGDLAEEKRKVISYKHKVLSPRQVDKNTGNIFIGTDMFKEIDLFVHNNGDLPINWNNVDNLGEDYVTRALSGLGFKLI